MTWNAFLGKSWIGDPSNLVTDSHNYAVMFNQYVPDDTDITHAAYHAANPLKDPQNLGLMSIDTTAWFCRLGPAMSGGQVILMFSMRSDSAFDILSHIAFSSVGSYFTFALSGNVPKLDPYQPQPTASAGEYANAATRPVSVIDGTFTSNVYLGIPDQRTLDPATHYLNVYFHLTAPAVGNIAASLNVIQIPFQQQDLPI